LPFEQKMIDEDRTLMAEFSKVTNGARMVPQILIDLFLLLCDYYHPRCSQDISSMY
jgi:hypothetical protein